MHTIGYDVIGDIHGHAQPLKALLEKLGYVRRDGTWVHSERTAVFVGDFVDRGPENLTACRIVMDMMVAGSGQAVMGNHDFNAICLATPDPFQPGEFLRRHTEKNLRQTAATRAEMERDPHQASAVLAWMRTLPLWIELEGLTVVHAAWAEGAKTALGPWLDSTGALTEDGIVRAARPGDPVRGAREIFLNGFEAPLPGGLSYVDPDGHERKEVRLAWWRERRARMNLYDAALVPGPLRNQIPNSPLVLSTWDSIPDQEANLIVFGQYWMEAPLKPLSPKHVCVDESIAKGGRLAAYRFSGEQVASAKQIVEVG